MRFGALVLVRVLVEPQLSRRGVLMKKERIEVAGAPSVVAVSGFLRRSWMLVGLSRWERCGGLGTLERCSSCGKDVWAVG